MAPHGYYPCAGDDAWLALAIRSDAEWQALCELMQAPERISEPQFRDTHQRIKQRAEIDALISQWTQAQDAEVLFQSLQAVGIAAMPLRTVQGRFHDTHLQARGTHSEIDHPGTGVQKMHNIPWHLSATPPRIQGPAPQVGEHNAYVLGEILGLSATQQKQLETDGVL